MPNRWVEEWAWEDTWGSFPGAPDSSPSTRHFLGHFSLEARGDMIKNLKLFPEPACLFYSKWEILIVLLRGLKPAGSGPVSWVYIILLLCVIEQIN